MASVGRWFDGSHGRARARSWSPTASSSRRESLADEVGGLAVQFDAGRESGVRALIAAATAGNGPIDIFISNAGVPGAIGGPEAGDDVVG